jgi:GT2 family glycosyltransferase
MVTAIIVNYHTAAFLPSLIHQLLDEACVDEVVVADNSGELSSGDALPSRLRPRVIRNERNIGFGPAVNRAVRETDGEWIAVINPDIRLGANCLDELVKAGTQWGSPLVGPRFYWDDNRTFRLPPATGTSLWLDFAGACAERNDLDRELYSFYWTLRHQRFWEADEPFFEPFLQGAFLLVRRDWVVANGGDLFDGRFFLYFEDTDLCAEALLKGVRPLCVPRAEVIHYYDQAPQPTDAKAALMARAHEGFLRKHYPNVALPVLEASPRPEGAIDMGTVTSAPVFSSDEGNWDGCFFEIGVNPYFVPFAQADAAGSSFAFPPDIWSGLSPGRYFGRIRHPLLGTRVIWQWKKP